MPLIIFSSAILHSYVWTIAMPNCLQPSCNASADLYTIRVVQCWQSFNWATMSLTSYLSPFLMIYVSAPNFLSSSSCCFFATSPNLLSFNTCTRSSAAASSLAIFCFISSNGRQQFITFGLKIWTILFLKGLDLVLIRPAIWGISISMLIRVCLL